MFPGIGKKKETREALSVGFMQQRCLLVFFASSNKSVFMISASQSRFLLHCSAFHARTAECLHQDVCFLVDGGENKKKSLSIYTNIFLKLQFMAVTFASSPPVPFHHPASLLHPFLHFSDFNWLFGAWNSGAQHRSRPVRPSRVWAFTALHDIFKAQRRKQKANIDKHVGVRTP